MFIYSFTFVSFIYNLESYASARQALEKKVARTLVDEPITPTLSPLVAVGRSCIACHDTLRGSATNCGERRRSNNNKNDIIMAPARDPKRWNILDKREVIEATGSNS